MRTTLDIDPVVLSAARAKASAEHISLGKAVSELALTGLKAPRANAGTKKFPVLQGAATHPVTNELVAEYRDDEPVAGDVA